MVMTIKGVDSARKEILQKKYNVINDEQSKVSIKIAETDSIINILKLLEHDNVQIKIEKFPIERIISGEKSENDEKLFSFSNV